MHRLAQKTRFVSPEALCALVRKNLPNLHVRYPPVAPGVSSRRRFPLQLVIYPLLRFICDEVRSDEDWFEAFVYWFIASLPGYHIKVIECHRTAAIWIVDELLQRRFKHGPLTPLALDKSGENGGAFEETPGLMTVQLKIDLHCINSEITPRFKELLGDLRKIASFPERHYRRVKIRNLQRDYVVFVLSEEDWPIDDMEQQLAHMGCLGLPKGCDAKAFVRRVRRRFEGLRQRIEALTDRLKKGGFSI